MGTDKLEITLEVLGLGLRVSHGSDDGRQTSRAIKRASLDAESELNELRVIGPSGPRP